jgi:hypothetical protein
MPQLAASHVARPFDGGDAHGVHDAPHVVTLVFDEHALPHK